MSRQLITRRVLKDGVMTGTNTLLSDPFSLHVAATLQLSFPTAGSPTGAWRVLVSNSWGGTRSKSLADAITDGDFQPLEEMAPVAIGAGPSDTIAINEKGFPYKYGVFEYVNATGTGVLQVDFTGAGIDAN